eukprot:bmy_11964T0
MALEQLYSVLKGKRPELRTAPPAGEAGVFASLPGAGLPTRPFVWRERIAEPPLPPGSTRSPSASPQPSACRGRGTGERIGTRRLGRPSELCPRASSSEFRTSLCKVVGFVGSYQKQLFNIYIIMDITYQKPSLEYYVLLITILVVEGIAVAQKTQDGQNIGIKHIPATQCGIWVRTSNGGHFASPNYPDSYPPNKECIYILEAAPRQRIELTFDEHYYIEPSFECRFDHLEVRDGPFGFSPLVDRYCGVKSPPLIRSTGRFMWIKFSSDEELEGLGFRAKYSFIPDPDFTYLGGILNPIPDCQFELSGADGIIRSSQVEQEEKTKPGQAVDCIWTIKATPKAKVVLSMQSLLRRT